MKPLNVIYYRLQNGEWCMSELLAFGIIGAVANDNHREVPPWAKGDKPLIERYKDWLKVIIFGKETP